MGLVARKVLSVGVLSVGVLSVLTSAIDDGWDEATSLSPPRIDHGGETTRRKSPH